MNIFTSLRCQKKYKSKPIRVSWRLAPADLFPQEEILRLNQFECGFVAADPATNQFVACVRDFWLEERVGLFPTIEEAKKALLNRVTALLSG